MSKQFKGSQGRNQETLGFYDFWQFIAQQLGDSRLTINSNAKTIHELFDASSDHKEFLRAAIRASYKRNTCHHLNAPINLSIVLDVLGETAYALQGQQCDDLMDIELLEEIAWHISERFGHLLETAGQGDQTNHSSGSSNSSATVISLPKIRIRRANAKI